MSQRIGNVERSQPDVTPVVPAAAVLRRAASQRLQLAHMLANEAAARHVTDRELGAWLGTAIADRDTAVDASIVSRLESGDVPLTDTYALAYAAVLVALGRTDVHAGWLLLGDASGAPAPVTPLLAILPVLGDVRMGRVRYLTRAIGRATQQRAAACAAGAPGAHGGGGRRKMPRPV